MQALGQRAPAAPARAAVRQAPVRRSVVRRALGEQAGANMEATLAGAGREWLGTILSRFGPATDRATNITTLEFEKPLVELDKRIKEVRRSPSGRPTVRYAPIAGGPGLIALAF
jgi:hypothetical protein